MEEKKERSFERRDELINAALIEFGDKGYENASLNNILKEAGISKGTFYYHFKNKEDLYIYLCHILAQEKMDFFNKYIDPHVFNRDIFEILKVMIKAGIEFAYHKPEIAKFSNSFLKDINNPIFDKVRQKLDVKNIDYLNALLDRAYERGEVREDLPKKFVKNIINFLLNYLRDVSVVADKEEYLEEANYLIYFIKEGLARKDNK
ncbi:MAG: TetR/AcrR family transcriptional regulator [Tissierellia bacterium]|nr:TetR/AcrR family transcriptional regulator [Tissierellia bacterium]